MPDRSPIVVWFRRDLRLADNPALSNAVESGAPVLPLYVHDTESGDPWMEGGASQWWLHHSLAALDRELRALGSQLTILTGDPAEVLLSLIKRISAQSVYWNRRYEPHVVKRDTKVKKRLADVGLLARSFNGGLLHSPLKIANKSGAPFRVFTPFWKHIQTIPVREELPAPSMVAAPDAWPASEDLDSLDLLPKLDWADAFPGHWEPGEESARKAFESFKSGSVLRYDQLRDFPAEVGVSRLSSHLHFGELSPVQIWKSLELEAHGSYMRQIAWREFAQHLLFHFPDTDRQPLNSKFADFPWSSDEALLRAWQRGRTGYPIVDAGMRELWTTGWMHNRVRMIASSFLVKHLLQPWQSGAAWFWDTLVDADLANNTMGWQWVAGCGADAAPYFRVFNPITQGEKFDPTGEYTRKWVPELALLPDKYLFKPWEAPANILEYAKVDLGGNYPYPIIEHGKGRASALEAYAKMKDNGA